MTNNNILEQPTRNTVNLLEQLAANASLQDESTLQATIQTAEITDACKNLIMAKNSQELAETLQLDKLITSVQISTPDEEEEQEQEEQQPEQSEEKISSFA